MNRAPFSCYSQVKSCFFLNWQHCRINFDLKKWLFLSAKNPNKKMQNKSRCDVSKEFLN